MLNFMGIPIYPNRDLPNLTMRLIRPGTRVKDRWKTMDVMLSELSTDAMRQAMTQVLHIEEDIPEDETLKAPPVLIHLDPATFTWYLTLTPAPELPMEGKFGAPKQ